MYGLVMAIVFVLLVLWGAYVIFRMYKTSQAKKLEEEQGLTSDLDDVDREDL